MQPSDDEPGAFELMLFADAETENVFALNHSFPGTHERRTKDLVKQHPDPRKSDLRSYTAAEMTSSFYQTVRILTLFPWN